MTGLKALIDLHFSYSHKVQEARIKRLQEDLKTLQVAMFIDQSHFEQVLVAIEQNTFTWLRKAPAVSYGPMQSKLSFKLSSWSVSLLPKYLPNRRLPYFETGEARVLRSNRQQQAEQAKKTSIQDHQPWTTGAVVGMSADTVKHSNTPNELSDKLSLIEELLSDADPKRWTIIDNIFQGDEVIE